MLESLEEGNQQPSIYRNIIEGSTTNGRDLTCNDEVSNFDTSALPDFIGDDIVWTGEFHIVYKNNTVSTYNLKMKVENYRIKSL